MHTPSLLGSFAGVNLNTTADQAIAIIAAKYIARRIIATNASGRKARRAGGVYTGAGKTGTIVVGAGQVYTSLTAALAALDMTIGAGAIGIALTAAQLFFSLTVAQGGAMTCDLFVFGDALG